MRRTFSHQCASCGEYSFDFIEGLHDETTYMWVCDNCGIQMNLRFFDAGCQVEQSPTGQRCERTLALLRMRNNPRFMFIHEGCAWGGALDTNEYYYHEHVCPASLLPCEEIVADGECDPHGVFELVAEHLITGPKAEPREEVLEKLMTMAVEQTKLA